MLTNIVTINPPVIPAGIAGIQITGMYTRESCRPWLLDSGNPCRNDDAFLILQ
ncbi:hypothetical protein KFZ76_02070 [Methylovulum psychrotolerans]|uniref:hypothetical protein n=1 Tax=Methylovulum psychrotolerans TaxID=1704499 RepID=UPI001BFEF8D0|nr:hypothetical protein [Methylovulum psychrotolerans]MBT9096495.1 hypothetical protein [Methylovulum psychrotolerans]